jgi:hypothetical protein
VPGLNMAPSMESGKRVKVSNVVEYSVPPTFRVTGPPKEGGEEDTGGGEILGGTQDRERRKGRTSWVQNWVVTFRLSGLEAQGGVRNSKVCSSPQLL